MFQRLILIYCTVWWIMLLGAFDLWGESDLDYHYLGYVNKICVATNVGKKTPRLLHLGQLNALWHLFKNTLKMYINITFDKTFDAFWERKRERERKREIEREGERDASSTIFLHLSLIWWYIYLTTHSACIIDFCSISKYKLILAK